jgi:hypothetical protein
VARELAALERVGDVAAAVLAEVVAGLAGRRRRDDAAAAAAAAAGRPREEGGSVEGAPAPKRAKGGLTALPPRE